MSKNPCKRKCWGCGNVAMHADDKTPDVCCSKCGSQDTRLIREKDPNVGPIYGVELIDTLPLGKTGGMLQAMPNRDDLRSGACERVAAGYEVLLAHYLELKKQSEKPTYTIQQAIDAIVDGLTLEWVASPSADYFRAVTIIGKYYAYADRWIDVDDNTDVCNSIDHGKQLCLADYKSRFWAEIEKAVATLHEPFTVEWLCEIGFERDEQYDHIRIVVPREHTTNAVTYLILTDPENATDSPWDMRTIYDDGTQEAVMVAEQITTRGDVLKWLDVLGIVPATTKGGDK